MLNFSTMRSDFRRVVCLLAAGAGRLGRSARRWLPGPVTLVLALVTAGISTGIGWSGWQAGPRVGPAVADLRGTAPEQLAAGRIAAVNATGAYLGAPALSIHRKPAEAVSEPAEDQCALVRPAGRPAVPGTTGSSGCQSVADESTDDSVGLTGLVVPTSFPTTDTTGVPAGTSLRRTGSLTLSTDGQVLSGLDIRGCVTVTARDVTIRKSRITCASRFSIRTIGAENLLVEDVEIDGSGVNTAAVCCSDYTLRRVEIRNIIDGPRLGDRTTVEASWIHHLVRVDGSHNDTLQTTGGSDITIRGNRLEAYNPTTDDPFNACLMIGSTTSPVVADLTYEQNYCNGGNYSIGIRPDLAADNVRLRANAYGRDHRYGVVARQDRPGGLWDGSTNIWAAPRLPVR